jgi:hypothetical protein
LFGSNHGNKKQGFFSFFSKSPDNKGKTALFFLQQATTVEYKHYLFHHSAALTVESKYS